MATSKSTTATGTGFKLSVMTLAIMNVTAVVSLRGLPSEAVYGPSSAFYYLFAAIVFLIPTALVAAELAAMFSDKQGGVFRWVGEAMGARTGFLAIWLQWIESTIWYPTVLTFGAVSIAFIGMDHSQDMLLASNKIYTLVVVLIIYWLATFISLKGLNWVGKVAKIGGMVGTIYFGFMTTMVAALHIFHPYALGMASGVGAGILMASATASLALIYPDMASELSALASTSETISGITGIYVAIFIGIPLTKKLYQLLEPPIARLRREPSEVLESRKREAAAAEDHTKSREER